MIKEENNKNDLENLMVAKALNTISVFKCLSFQANVKK